MDFSELVAEVSTRSGLPGLAMRAEHLTRLAEAELNKRLTVGDQEDTRTLTTGTDKIARLPADFLVMRGAARDGRGLRQWPLGDVLTGCRCGYAIRGRDMVTSWAESDLEITYYRGVPPLAFGAGDWDATDWDDRDWAVASDSNWLLEQDPELYIYALLKQWLAFHMDQRVVAVDAYLGQLVQARNQHDLRARFSHTRMQTAGPTP